MTVKIHSMQTPAGNTSRNQYILSDRNGDTFVSYGTNIARRKLGVIYLDETYWDYSATTGRYRNQFLGEGINDTRKGIKSGRYTLTNLNK